MSQLKAVFVCFALCYCSILSAKTPNLPVAVDFTLKDITGVERQLYNYLNQGKSVILNFSSTWCKPCWNYEKTGIMDQVWETFGPGGTDEVVIIFIEADETTCTDCLFGQENCNDFTYGDWTEKPYPAVSLQGTSLGLNQTYNVKRFPSIIGISSSDFSITNLGQLSFNNWDSWISRQVNKNQFSFLNRVEASKNESLFFNEEIKKPMRSFAQIIVDETLEIEINLFPNPSVNRLHIKLKNSEEMVAMSLFNSEGRRITAGIPYNIVEGTVPIDVSHLNPGLYFLNFKSGKTNRTERFLKVK